MVLFSFKSFCDETADLKIKKVNYLISFYSLDEYDTIFDDALYSFKKVTELDLTCKFYFTPYYTFMFFINNIFEFDFYEIYRLYNEKGKGYIDNNSLYNTFTFDLSNEFSIKKMVKIALNFDFINEVSSDKKDIASKNYLSISAVPWIKLSGNYYFGYFWDLSLYQYFEFLPQENYNKYITSSYFKTGVQFFRFYGPKNFKFSILLDDEFYYDIYQINFDTLVLYIQGSIDNLFRAGVKFNFFNFEPFLYFINDVFYSLNDIFFNYNNNSFGIDLGLKYSIDGFTLSAEYIGIYDILSNEKKWLNEIDFYFKFNVRKSNN